MNISLLKLDLFEGISSPDILLMEQVMQVKKLKKRQKFYFNQSENFFAHFLIQGLIKSVISNKKGQELIKFIVQPGNFVNDIPFVGYVERELAYAEALEHSVVILLNMDIIRQWINTYEHFSLKVNQFIGVRMHELQNRLMTFVYESSEKRIAEFLVGYIKQFGEECESGWKARNLLTNTDIGQFTANSRQTVSQVLNDLRNKKRINYNSRFIEIPATSSLLKKH